MKKLSFKIFLMTLLMISVQTSFAFGKESERSFAKSLEDEYAQKLVNDIKENGFVRVWIHYGMDTSPEYKIFESVEKEYAGQDVSTKFEAFAERAAPQRDRIQKQHDNFMSKIDQEELGIRAINKMGHSPQIAMNVDKEALAYLLNMPMVDKITEVNIYSRHIDYTLHLS